jgi:hypothetical protein
LLVKEANQQSEFGAVSVTRVLAAPAEASYDPESSTPACGLSTEERVRKYRNVCTILKEAVPTATLGD